MKQDMICDRGHRWALPADSDSATLDAAFLCPTCGGNGHHTSADPNLTLAGKADPNGARDTDPQALRVAGYEILRELGRGGMGVVYLARQQKLDRLVALKMVLAGSHASDHEQQRFMAEAAAVARLQHPNIVQIHEIGEAEGHPFFSLEYVDGGSLAGRLDGTPLPSRQAAELIIPLARAVQPAHAAGIIHRDLKPGNILIGGGEEIDPAAVKITDFGLAKRSAVPTA